MTTFLTSLLIAINIVTLMYVVIIWESIKRIKKHNNAYDDINDDKMVQGELSVIIDGWREQNKEEINAKACKYNTFENLDDFLDYIISVASGEQTKNEICIFNHLG